MDESKHFTNAPEALRAEFAAAMDAARESAQTDDLERVDWAAISRAMTDWWAERGYLYP